MFWKRLRHGLTLVLIACLATAVLTPPRPALALVVKLSGLIPDTADVSSFQISPTGNRVVYMLRTDSVDTSGMFSVPLVGGTPMRVSTALSTSCCPILEGYWITPDGSRVVYVYWNATNSVDRGLFVAPIDGSSAAVHLITPTGNQTNLGVQLTFTPDSQRAIYRTNETGHPIYSIKLDGSEPPRRLTPVPVTGGDIPRPFILSPDGGYVVYRSDQETDGLFELFSISTTIPGAVPVKLNPVLPTGGSVGDPVNSATTNFTDFLISPDSTRVVYMASQEVNNEVEVYSVPIAGPSSSSVRLSVPRPTGFTVALPEFKISADSTRVVYLNRVSGGETEPVTRDIYSVPIAGPAGSSISLGPGMQPGGTFGDFFVTTNRVVYSGRINTTTDVRLYSAPLGGPASSAVQISRGATQTDDFAVTPDGSQVVYYDFVSGAGYARVLATGPATTNKTLEPPGTSFSNYVISPSSELVVFSGSTSSGGTTARGLWGGPVFGVRGQVKITGPMIANGNIDSYEITTDSRYVVYLADREIDNKWELFLADISGYYVHLSNLSK